MRGRRAGAYFFNDKTGVSSPFFIAQCLYTISEDNEKIIELVQQKPTIFSNLPQLVHEFSDSGNTIFLSVLVSGKVLLTRETHPSFAAGKACQPEIGSQSTLN